MSVRHFLSLLDLTTEELRGLIARATELKRMHYEGVEHTPSRARPWA